MSLLRNKAFYWWFGLFLLGIIYVSQAWSPSSYGFFLQQIEASNEGLVYGQPRPIRSDEWAVVTPLTQATVNNDFQRYNQTSPYQEDLRINYGLPVFDWGLLFKPTMWLYAVTNPATAYSFHWYATFALFVVGYTLLFSLFNVGRLNAALLSLGLYFTGYAQFWWNEKGPIFALFPWVVLVLFFRLPMVVRLGLFYWVSASWMITNFYPPLFISLGFVGALIILARGQPWLQWKPMVTLALTAVCSALTVAFYLKDYLLNTMSTLYPGARSEGGGEVPVREWLTQFFPYAHFDWQYENLTGLNISEIGTVGIAFVLLALCCLDYRRLHVLRAPGNERRTLTILGAGLLAMSAWMLLPLPPWVGKILLWNNIPAERMGYAEGVVLILLTLLIVRQVGLVVSLKRIVIFSSLTLLVWCYANITTSAAWLATTNNLVIVPLALMACLLARKQWVRQETALLMASTIAGCLVLFSFNPIQSAWPIFNRQPSSVQKELDQLVDSDSGLLAVPDYRGATLNGLGYKSISHVTPVPALDFWRKRYPGMSEQEFERVFNRYSHISLMDASEPYVIYDDRVGVPQQDFGFYRVTFPQEGNDAQPYWLKPGMMASGTVTTVEAGRLHEFALVIGNGQNSADGKLVLSLCANHTCERVERTLATSTDNDFLRFWLPEPLSVREGEKLRYTLALQDATHDVAIWVFSVDDHVGPLTSPKQPDDTKGPRIRIVSTH